MADVCYYCLIDITELIEREQQQNKDSATGRGCSPYNAQCLLLRLVVASRELTSNNRIGCNHNITRNLVYKMGRNRKRHSSVTNTQNTRNHSYSYKDSTDDGDEYMQLTRNLCQEIVNLLSAMAGDQDQKGRRRSVINRQNCIDSVVVNCEKRRVLNEKTISAEGARGRCAKCGSFISCSGDGKEGAGDSYVTLENRQKATRKRGKDPAE